MGKTEKIGGIGKSPAIDKISAICRERTSGEKDDAVKKCVFEKETDGELDKMNEIIDRYSISFSTGK